MKSVTADQSDSSLCMTDPWQMFSQVSNLPVNLLPVAYSSQSHGQSSYSSDDLPKTVVMTLSQGSIVKSMDFHPLQQILLLGKPLFGVSLFILIISSVSVCCMLCPLILFCVYVLINFC